MCTFIAINNNNGFKTNENILAFKCIKYKNQKPVTDFMRQSIVLNRVLESNIFKIYNEDEFKRYGGNGFGVDDVERDEIERLYNMSDEYLFHIGKIFLIADGIHSMLSFDRLINLINANSIRRCISIGMIPKNSIVYPGFSNLAVSNQFKYLYFDHNEYSDINKISEFKIIEISKIIKDLIIEHQLHYFDYRHLTKL